MEEHVFFTFSLIIEGTTEKSLQFIMSLKSIYNNCILEHYKKANT
jgi:hypothetical protein